MVSNEFSSTYTFPPSLPKNDSINVPSRLKGRVKNRAKAMIDHLPFFDSESQTHSLL